MQFFAFHSVIWIQGKTNYLPDRGGFKKKEYHYMRGQYHFFINSFMRKRGLILRLLIRDMNDPFEIGKKSNAVVDQTLLCELEKELLYCRKNN